MGQRSSIISLVQTAAEEQIENVLLNESGIDLYGVDTESRNALHLASAEGRTRVVSLLLEHANFDVNALDIHGNSALHLAVFKNHDQVAALLLDKGANVNLQDANGMTPLHWAVYENNVACVELLVGRKADQSIFNAKGQTVQSIARGLRKKFREKMLKILQSDTTLQSQLQDINNTENVSSSSKQLSGLCALWGFIKYTHPYLGYRKDINWDKAFLEATREIIETEYISEKNYFHIIEKMLWNLKDPNTYIEYEAVGVQTQPPVNSVDLSSPPSVRDDGNAQATLGDKTQPYVQILDTNVALVVATHYGQFTKVAKVENLKNAFNSAINTANTMVIDIRALQPEDPFFSSNILLAYIFEEAFRMFLTDDLVLPTKRQSLWNGHPEHRRTMSRTFFHGMMIYDAETINASSKSQQQKIPLKPMTFLINKNTPQHVINIISALQTSHVCTMVYQVEASHVRPDPDVPGGVLLYEPGVTPSIFDLGNAKVYVRQNEIINSDNSVGFHPDVTIVKGEEFSKLSQVPSAKDIAAQFSDPAVQVAIALVLKKIPSQRKQPVPVIFTKRYVDSPFPDIPSIPPPEFRLLGLCRIWNAIQYFYPYKSRISRPLKEILESAIPTFLSATSELAYGMAVVDVVREIRDSQAYVNSGVLLEHIGTHVPPLMLKTIDREGDVVIVAQVLREHVTDVVDVRPGDIVVTVNGEDIHERFQKLSKLLSCSSTEHTKDIRVLSLALAGPVNSIVKVGLRRTVVSLEEEVKDPLPLEIEIEIPRLLLPQKLHVNALSTPYTILEQKDKIGNKIGYIDLRILSIQSVLDAMQYVRDTSSLILDIRGHTKAAGYKLAQYLTKKKVVSCVTVTPFIMPSLLVDGAEPINVLNQSFSPGDPSTLYFGTIVVLVDNSTISHGELTCLFLRSCRPDTIFVGTPTYGTMGYITNIILPGNVEVGFVGLGFLSSDGSKTQGVVPDVIVQETISGSIEEKDEILEHAILHLQK